MLYTNTFSLHRDTFYYDKQQVVGDHFWTMESKFGARTLNDIL